MNIKRLTLVFVVMFSALCVSAQKSLEVYINDTTGTPTNIRSAPNGKIVGSLADTCIYMLDVKNPQNGWWAIDDNSVFGICSTDTTFDFSSKCKTAWIHYSVLGFSTRNYGGQRYVLYSQPSEKSAENFAFTEEMGLRPLDFKKGWVYVETYDKKHRGWIQLENICANPLTNCC